VFNVGDIVRQKQSMGRDNKVYYALIVSIQYSPCHDISLSRVTAQWLNWDDKSVKFKGLNFNWHEDSMLTYREAQLWWDKVE